MEILVTGILHTIHQICLYLCINYVPCIFSVMCHVYVMYHVSCVMCHVLCLCVEFVYSVYVQCLCLCLCTMFMYNVYVQCLCTMSLNNVHVLCVMFMFMFMFMLLYNVYVYCGLCYVLCSCFRLRLVPSVYIPSDKR